MCVIRHSSEFISDLLPILTDSSVLHSTYHTNSIDNKIEESSKNLLNVIKRETKSIQKSLNAKNAP
jgi:hypothetical protein